MRQEVVMLPNPSSLQAENEGWVHIFFSVFLAGGMSAVVAMVAVAITAMGTDMARRGALPRQGQCRVNPRPLQLSAS